MTKKSAKHSPSKESSHIKTITKNSSELQVEKVLVENFVALQKVLTNLAVKFDNLSDQISKLLQLFEISAKALAEKEYDLEKGNKDNDKIIKKIDNLFEQNKIIARGLTLLHEGGESEKIQEHEMRQPAPFSNPMPLEQSEQTPGTMPQTIDASQYQGRSQMQRPVIDANQYQKSISSPPTAFKRLPRI